MREGEPRTIEQETPEQSLESAIKTAEKKDSEDPIISSEWMKKTKQAAKLSGVLAGVSLGLLLYGAGKITSGLFEFTKTAIKKKGNVSFKEGYDMGEKVFSFENKDKK